MKIERRFHHLTVFSEDTVREALDRIGRNRRRVVFCVDTSGVLEGVLTDGDVRRWLLAQDDVDLERPVLGVANTEFTAAHVDADPAAIAGLFSERVLQVPLVDDRGRLVAVADRDDAPLRIAGREIGAGAPVFAIAEIGVNHNGRVDHGRRLIDLAVAAGADCAKFQMRDLASLYRHSGATDDAREDLGSQYVLDLLSRFELTPDEMVVKTVLCNAPEFRSGEWQIDEDCKRYFDFSKSKLNHPKWLGAEDLPAMYGSGAHFARKFDWARSGEVLDELDAHMAELSSAGADVT